MHAHHHDYTYTNFHGKACTPKELCGHRYQQHRGRWSDLRLKAGIVEGTYEEAADGQEGGARG